MSRKSDPGGPLSAWLGERLDPPRRRDGSSYDEERGPQGSVSRASCPQIFDNGPGQRLDARLWTRESRCRDRPAAMPASRADHAAEPGNGREQRGTTRATRLPTPRTPKVNAVGDRRRRHVLRTSPTQLPRPRRRERGDGSGRRPGTQQVENHRSPAALRAVPPPDQVVPLAQSVRMGPLLESIASTGSPSGFQPFSGPWLRFSGRSSGRYRSPWEHDGERPAPPVCAHSTGKAECIRKQEAARRRT